MKIFFVTSTLASGGSERVISLLANSLSKRKHEVEIICLNRHIVFYSIEKTVKVVFAEEETNASFIGIKMLWLRRYVKRMQPDVVLPFMSDVYSVTLLSLIGNKTPVISSERYDPRASNLFFKMMRWLFLRLTTHLVVQTENIKSYYSKRLQQRTTVIYNPVSSRLSEGESKYVDFNKQNRIISVGRLAPQKNYPMLLRAFKDVHEKFQNWKLVIFGEGPDRVKLEKLIEDLELNEDVLLPGRSDQIDKELGQSKIFCMSTNAEGMSNALIEAICSGLPVITTDVSGAREIVDDGKSGFIVPIGNEQCMVEAMHKLLSDETLIKEMGERNCQKRSLFELETIVSQWEELIKKVVNEKL